MSAGREMHLPLMDDMHLHLRDADTMASLLAQMPAYIRRAIIMPNLKPPVRTAEDAIAYHKRITAATRSDHAFQPLMTLYLTDSTTADDIRAAAATGLVYAVKYYPAGATTNADCGVTDIRKCLSALSAMEESGLPLCIHGEVTDPTVDIFDREPAFLRTVLPIILEAVPTLKVVLEHITTKEAVEFVSTAGPNVAATITAHHLLYNRNALFEGGIRPHRYCLPILKHENDRQALVAAIQSGSPKFFAGTDSAPHAKSAKECPCGAAGMFTANAAIELYALSFERAGCMDKLADFLGTHGARFYGLPPLSALESHSVVVLREDPWTVPDSFTFGASIVVPCMAGETLKWRATYVPNTA